MPHNSEQVQKMVDNIEAIPKRHSKKRVIIFAVTIILNLGLVVLLVMLLLTPRLEASHSTDDLSLIGDISSPLIGKPASDFSLPLVNNHTNTEKLRLMSLKGVPLVLNFWSSTCIPCINEADFLQQSGQKLQAKHSRLIGISIDTSRSDALQFIKKYQITYLNVQDDENASTLINYGATGTPETFFINTNGTIAALWVGPLDQKGMRGELQKIHVYI